MPLLHYPGTTPYDQHGVRPIWAIEDTCRMQIVSTAIPEVKEIRPVRHGDPRGFFSEIFRESVLRENGVDVPFVQENHSLSVDQGVVRGLHFQIPPEAQDKL